jgi:Xaa-Pro aminopeptidase
MFEERHKKLRVLLEKENLDVLAVSGAHNQLYLTGFAGRLSGARAFLLISADKTVLITDHRYFESAEKELSFCEVSAWEKPGFEELYTLIKREGWQNVGIEAAHLSLEAYYSLAKSLKNIKLVPTYNLVEKLRLTKDKTEIELIKKAAFITSTTFEFLLSIVRAGVKESEIAAEIEFFMKRKGADKVAFDVIVASGSRSSVPHAETSQKEIKSTEIVKVDFGARYRFYNSDMTRTIFVGKASSEQRKIYNIVRSVQEEILLEVKPGLPCQELDKKARAKLEKYGLANSFKHNLGHGVGLEIHEAPTLSVLSREVLSENMVVTIEPGVYIRGFGGVRIEDLVLVTGKGAEVLTQAPKDLLEV